jgi:hypothetical protein
LEETTMHGRKPQLLACAVIIAAAGFLLDQISGRAAPTTIPRPLPTAGYVVHIDPLTGEFTPAPSPSMETKSDEWLQNALRTSSQGLIEEPSPVAGGGIMVDLRGRFQNVFVAALDDSGGLSAACSSGDLPLCEDGGGSQ